MQISIKANNLICQMDYMIRACSSSVKYGKGKSFISRSAMMENAIKAADDVSDWVYVHSQLLKFQAEHITMQDIPVFKTYQAEVDDSYEESFTRKKKEAYDVLKARCIVSRLQQSYFVALLLMNFFLSLKKNSSELSDDDSEDMPLEDMAKTLVEMILQKEHCKNELQEIKDVMLKWQRRKSKNEEAN